MSKAIEQPPILRGAPGEQTAQLRDYLVRMLRELQSLGDEQALEQRVTKLVSEGSKTATAAAALDARKRASDLKSLIIKTADEVYEVMDRRVTELSGIYVAQSDFGIYAENIERTIEDTARSTVESFQFDTQLEAANTAIAELEVYVTTLNGQIRRGVIEDPGTHEDVLGIAISEEVSFTGQTVDENGVTYYRISPGQTFGLYTSKGWQFWIGGVKAAWLDAVDGKLHVANVQIEETLQMGGDWMISTDGGYGIRYIGV